MHADLAAHLSPGARKQLGGTDLEYDTDRLEQLASVVPEEQESVVRAHVNLRVPWCDALVGRTLRSLATPIREARPLEVPTARRIERREVSDLKPNRFNAALFPDSLSEASISVLAEDLARNGQRVPGEVTPDGTIIDCERRWRAAKLLGWEKLDVTVVDGLTDDDVLDRVLDSCTSVRHLSLREQVNVYGAVCERLKREAGRDVGRQDQIIPKGIICLTPRSIKDAAAKRAGFSSTTLALRAEAVFSRGAEDLQAKVRDGAVTITAAYDQLPKRPKAKTVAAESAAEDALGKGDVSPIVEPVHAAPASAGAFAPVPTSPPTDPEDEDQDESAAHDDANGTMEDTPCQTEGATDEEEQATEATDEEVGEPEADLIGAPQEDELDIAVHVSAVCGYLSRLASVNYEDAVACFDQVVEEMRGSVGEPPEFDEEEAFDE